MNQESHHRRSIRLKGYDYSQPGAYFVTICTHDRRPIFGTITKSTPSVGAGFTPAQVELTDYGRIAFEQWYRLADRFANVELDAFVVMPNHIHGIIWTFDGQPNIRQHQSGQPQSGQPQGLPLRQADGIMPNPVNLGDIVGAYKSLVSNECLKIFRANNENMGKLWQRNYYEHIIRNNESYRKIGDYISNNPIQWENDRYFQEGAK